MNEVAVRIKICPRCSNTHEGDLNDCLICGFPMIAQMYHLREGITARCSTCHLSLFGGLPSEYNGGD